MQEKVSYRIKKQSDLSEKKDRKQETDKNEKSEEKSEKKKHEKNLVKREVTSNCKEDISLITNDLNYSFPCAFG